jgi:hypothetical protein
MHAHWHALYLSHGRAAPSCSRLPICCQFVPARFGRTRCLRCAGAPRRPASGSEPGWRRVEADRLHLTYRVRIGGGDWEDAAETVRIVSSAWSPADRQGKTGGGLGLRPWPVAVDLDERGRSSDGIQRSRHQCNREDQP